MPFVKLDCAMLNSTIWFDREAREVFITALLMAEPIALSESMAQLKVDSLDTTDWSVPPGRYGFVPAAGVGIVRRAGIEQTAGIEALRRLGQPEDGSRTSEYDGRRLVRVDGGYIVLNYFKYRDQDYTAAERQRRYRDRKRNAVTEQGDAVMSRNITHAEAEAEAEAEKRESTQVVPLAAVPESAIPVSEKDLKRKEAWDRIVAQAQIPEKRKEQYLKPCYIRDMRPRKTSPGFTLELNCPSTDTMRWVSKHYRNALVEAAATAYPGAHFDFQFVCKPVSLRGGD
jgi:hypothetical protein